VKLKGTAAALFLVFTTFLGIAVPGAAARAASLTEPPCSIPGQNYVWCIWTGINATGDRLASGYSIANLDTVGFRNMDESLENNGSGPAGGSSAYLYYSPNYAGAYFCMPANFYISNAGNFHFNQGKGLAGYGQTLWRNVASVRILGDGAC
jgi:hypothetical protein